MQADAMSESYLAEDAEILLVGFGISSRIARTTAETLRKEGITEGDTVNVYGDEFDYVP